MITRYPWASVARLTRLSDGLLAEAVGVTRETLNRWKREGVPERQTDSVAVAIGLVPCLVWPEQCAEAEAALVAQMEAAEADRKRRAREAHQRWLEKNREKMRALNRRSYARHRDQRVRESRLYRQRNAEEYRAARRERYQRTGR